MGTIKAAGQMLDYHSGSHYENASMTMALQPYPQTSHGMRNQRSHRVGPGSVDISAGMGGEQLAIATLPHGEVEGFERLGLAQHLDYNTGNDYKKVQTAMPRKRRNVMTKSQVAPKTQQQAYQRAPSSNEAHLPVSIMSKIEQGKYMTDKDKAE